MSFGRLPPAGVAIGASTLVDALRVREPEREMCAALRDRLGARDVALFASGREALRVALDRLRARSGRDEVVVPSYTCFSVPAAAVAAGMRVRLVDVTARGWIDLDRLRALPLEKAAAVVVCNLFGVAEPLEPVRAIAAGAGTAVIDDAAQALGATTAEGPAGGRGDAGILSFGRGKPLSALGGGALVWPQGAGTPADVPDGLQVPTAPRRGRALRRALAYDLALAPAVFGVLAAVPALGIGETRFDPDFARGAIDGAALALAAALLRHLDAAAAAQQREAERLAAEIRARTRFEPIVGEGAGAVYPRLAVRAPDAAARRAALDALGALGAGASPFYPSSLASVPALERHLAVPDACPGGADLAGRLLTLPTHGRLRGRRREAALAALEAS